MIEPRALLLLSILWPTNLVHGQSPLVVHEAIRESETAVLVSFNALLFDDELTIGELILRSGAGQQLAIGAPQRVTHGPLVFKGKPRTLVSSFRVRLSDKGAQLDENQRYTLSIGHIKHGQARLENLTLPVNPKKLPVLIDEAYQDSANSVLVRFQADFDPNQVFDEGQNNRGEIILSDTSNKSLEIGEITPLVEHDGDLGPTFSEMRLTLVDGFLDPRKKYRVVFEKLEDDTFLLRDQSASVKALGGSIEFNRVVPNELFVTFPNSVLADKVIVKRAGVEIDIVSRQLSGDKANAISILLNKPVQHGESIEILALDAEGSRIVAKSKVAFKAPKDRKEAILFTKLSAEAGKGQKPNVTVDFKADYKERIDLGAGWTFGPTFDAVVATRDKDESNKLSFLVNFHRIGFFGKKKVNPWAYRLEMGPRLEFDKGFSNANAVADVSLELFKLNWLKLGRKTDASNKNPTVWYVRPKIGWEFGENLGLQTKLAELEGYSLSRAVFELAIGSERKLKKIKNLESVTFALAYTARELFSEELDTVDIPKVEQTDDSGTTKVILADGFKDYLTATLGLKVSEHFGIELKYESGEQPGLFEDKDKVSLGLTYLY